MHHGVPMTAKPVLESNESKWFSEIVGKMYFNEGLSLALARHYDQAVPRLEQASLLCPERSAPLMVLAKIAFYRGEVARSQSYLDRCSNRPDVDPQQVAQLHNALKAKLRRVERNDKFQVALRIAGSRIANGIRDVMFIQPSHGFSRHRLLLLIAMILSSVLIGWVLLGLLSDGKMDAPSLKEDAGAVEKPSSPTKTAPVPKVLQPAAKVAPPAAATAQPQPNAKHSQRHRLRIQQGCILICCPVHFRLASMR